MVLVGKHFTEISLVMIVINWQLQSGLITRTIGNCKGNLTTKMLFNGGSQAGVGDKISKTS